MIIRCKTCIFSNWHVLGGRLECELQRRAFDPHYPTTCVDHLPNTLRNQLQSPENKGKSSLTKRRAKP